MIIKLKNKGDSHIRFNFLGNSPTIIFPPNSVLEFEDEFYFKRDRLPIMLKNVSIWDVTNEPNSVILPKVVDSVQSVEDETLSSVESTPPTTDLSDVDKFGVDPEKLWGMSKTELQDHALRLDLDTSGLKADLVEKITNHIKEN